MNLQTIRRKSTELLAVTILFTLAAIGWYAFLFAEVKAKNEHISDLANQITSETVEGETLTAKKKLVAEVVPLRAKLASYSVAKDEAVAFIEFLERTGNAIGAHITIESVSESELPPPAAGKKLKLTLTATGTWPSVVRFLGLLEFLPYETDVERVMLSQTQSEIGDPWRASFLLTALKEK